jgi:hypothetical protein
MPAQLETAAGAPITHIAFDLVSLESSPPVIVYADPDAAGSFLRSGTSTAFRLKARLNGTADAYQYLDGAGIAIAGIPPVAFDLICEALSVVGLVRDAVAIVVSRSGAAGWNS